MASMIIPITYMSYQDGRAYQGAEGIAGVEVSGATP